MKPIDVATIHNFPSSNNTVEDVQITFYGHGTQIFVDIYSPKTNTTTSYILEKV